MTCPQTCCNLYYFYAFTFTNDCSCECKDALAINAIKYNINATNKFIESPECNVYCNSKITLTIKYYTIECNTIKLNTFKLIGTSTQICTFLLTQICELTTYALKYNPSCIMPKPKTDCPNSTFVNQMVTDIKTNNCVKPDIYIDNYFSCDNDANSVCDYELVSNMSSCSDNDSQCSKSSKSSKSSNCNKQKQKQKHPPKPQPYPPQPPPQPHPQPQPYPYPYPYPPHPPQQPYPHPPPPHPPHPPQPHPYPPQPYPPK